MTIRLKLTLWYSSIVALTVLIFSMVLYTTVWRNSLRDIDTALRRRAESVASSIFLPPGMALRAKSIVIPDVDVFSGADVYVQVLDSSGDLVAKSANLGSQSLPITPDILTVGNGSPFRTEAVSGSYVRIYTVPILYRNSIVGFIQVGRSLQPLMTQLNRLKISLVLVSLATVLFAGAVGWLMAKTALKPIDKLTRSAREIGEKRDFGKRVAYRGPADEIGKLAATFNMMLDGLEQAYNHLEMALAGQKRFVADASHELRTPLTVIKGNVQLLRKSIGLDPEGTEEAIQDIEFEVDRLSRMASELLDLARADAGQHIVLAPVDLVEVITSVAKRLAVLASDRDFNVTFDPAISCVPVMGSAEHLERVLTILVDNAVKYTEPGGKINVSLSVSDHYAIIKVKDNGSGIAKEDLPRIFERFYRADKTRYRSGTGLGLAIAKWIVSEHGGQIDVTSELKKGSEFTIRIPMLSQGETEKSIRKS
ncbi:MAG TPA: HAMP domain-containing histidine kinase [Firmicutes bacterium]|nr:HAMP domain-containing histidine kinase [Bacillota bacterium]